MSAVTRADLARLRRVLVIRRRALGDALVSLPAVAALADACPRAELDLLIDRPFAPLIGAAIAGANVLPWPPRRDDPHAHWLRWLRGRDYDLVVDVLSTPQTAVWTALSGARLRAGFDLRWRRWAYNVRVPRARVGGRRVHRFAGEEFQALLTPLGIVAPPWRPAALNVPAVALGTVYRDWAAGWETSAPRPRVGLVLSASLAVKAWPATAAAALTRLLAEKGIATLLITGPGDAKIVADTFAAGARALEAPPTTLPELVDLCGRLDALVATDCGARHVAAAAGLPTVTLFGPTDPGGWNQEHPLHVAVRNPVPCSPCDLKVCPVPGHPCLDRLAPEAVAAALEAVLARCGAPAKETVR